MFISLSSFLAQAPAAPGAGGILGNPMIMMVLMFVMMYFLLIRPQRLRQKELEKLISSVKVGDHVILSGGEHGIITSTKEKTVMIKLADNVKVEYERSAIASVSKKTDVVEATAA
jgi:preprotein translocase subunit YajC